MAFPAAPDPHSTPIHVLFPEHYERSKRTIALDFLFLGGLIVGAIVFGAWMNVIATP